MNERDAARVRAYGKRGAAFDAYVEHLGPKQKTEDEIEAAARKARNRSLQKALNKVARDLEKKAKEASA